MKLETFNPLKKTSASSLKEEGSRILNVFTKTKEDLKKLNDKQSEYLTAVDAEIDKLRTERALVVGSIQDNGKVISKIEEFLK
jgi:flagellar biosynthesis chaperone FliJ